MFGRVDLTFKHYITAETLKNNYLVVPNMFFEKDEFRDPRTVSQIDTCLVKFELWNVSYYTYDTIYNFHRYPRWQTLLLKREQDNFPVFNSTIIPFRFAMTDRSAPGLDTATKPYGHPDRMHSYKCPRH